MFLMWSLEASSGTTPPYSACISCEYTTLERISFPSLTTAAAVSSQEVSIPSITIFVKGATETILTAITQCYLYFIKHINRTRIQQINIELLVSIFFPYSLNLISTLCGSQDLKIMPSGRLKYGITSFPAFSISIYAFISEGFTFFKRFSSPLTVTLMDSG